jgi:predicted RNA-binding Zn ribbon-like protein
LRDKASNRSDMSSLEASRIAILVRFISADFNGFREGDWLNLRDDLASFLSEDSGLAFIPTDDPPSCDVSNMRLLRRLQKQVRDLMRPLAESQSAIGSRSSFRRELARHSELKTGSNSSSQAIEMFLETVFKAGERPRVRLAMKYLDAVYCKAALLLLDRPGPDVKRLRLCPECGNVFLRVRKQLYCTRRCVNRANMRAWLERPHGKASHSASSKRTWILGKPRKAQTR